MRADKTGYQCLLVSDFNIEQFSRLLENNGSPPFIQPQLAPFGQVQQVLANPGGHMTPEAADFSFVWCFPESVVPEFERATRGDPVDLERLLTQVDDYADRLIRFGENFKATFVSSWISPFSPRGSGLNDLNPGSGLGYLLLRMNLRLTEQLSVAKSTYVLNLQNWTSGASSISPKTWYLGKVPFSNALLQRAVTELKSAIRSVSGMSRKVAIVDLDDTLWGGIVGDVGWQNLRLGGHDHLGEAFVDFQMALKALSKRGVLLGIVSKNEESIALEAITRHPEMVLNLEDFAGWKINWDDKAKNVMDLVRELNLGLDSAVFIDDNPTERARVASALPDVLVPEWPGDKTMYKSALLSLDCFDTATVTEEDVARANAYAAERNRSQLRDQVESQEDWLKQLNVTVRVEALNGANLKRVVQLLNKTNQMNLTTRRMTESEFADWSAAEQSRVFAIRVSDAFGDSGLTGIVSYQLQADAAKIVDLVLSCRVMGKGVEETLLSIAISKAAEDGAKRIELTYLPTEKNKPMQRFLKGTRLSRSAADDTFCWDLSEPYPKPDHVAVRQ